MAGIAPTRMAAAFSDPEQMLKHISADELQRLVEGSIRLEAFALQLAAAFKIAEAAYEGSGVSRPSPPRAAADGESVARALRVES
jgi:hypothetical protein